MLARPISVRVLVINDPSVRVRPAPLLTVHLAVLTASLSVVVLGRGARVCLWLGLADVARHVIKSSEDV